MDRNNIWIPLITSVSVGAATFYAMSKNKKQMSKTAAELTPILTEMVSNENNSEENEQNIETIK